MKHSVLLFIVGAILFFPRLGEQDLWPSHEARAAQNAASMLASGDWGLPYLFDGTPEYQKPPGDYWLIALLSMFNGGEVTPWTVRLPAAIAALLTILAVYVLLATLDRPIAGITAALMLATAVRFTTYARVGRIDMVLTAAITLGLVAVILGVMRNRRGLGMILGGVCFGFALLLKGPIGLALPLAVGMLWCLVERRWPPILPMIIGLLTVAVVAMPWLIGVQSRTNGEFMRVFFWYHNVGRALGTTTELATHPVWFYLPRLLIDLLPWSPLLVGTLILAIRRGTLRTDPLAQLGLIWLVAMIAVLSISRFKRAEYLLPAYPGGVIVIACLLETRIRMWTNRRSTILIASGLIVASLSWWVYDRTLLPPQAAPREMRAFAQRIRELAPQPEPIVLFAVEAHLLAWHLKPPIRTITTWDDLDAHIQRSPDALIVLSPESWAEYQTRQPGTPFRMVITLTEMLPVPPLRPLIAIRTGRIP